MRKINIKYYYDDDDDDDDDDVSDGKLGNILLGLRY